MSSLSAKLPRLKEALVRLAMSPTAAAFLLVAAYRLIRPRITSDVPLGLGEYATSSMLIERFANLDGLLVVAATGAGLWLGRERLRWEDFDGGRWTRLVIGGSVLALAWAFAFYDVNLWYGEEHVFDRLALIALAGLVIYRPIFALPFALALIVIIGQFQFPLPQSITDKRPMYDVLILFVAFLPIQLALRPRREVFLVIAMAVVVSNYVVSGWGKIELAEGPLDWVFHNELHNLILSSHEYGWLGFAGEGFASGFAEIVDVFDVPFQVLAFAIELGAISALIYRRASVIAILLAVGFHLAVLFTAGVFFWKWVIVDLLLVAAVVGGLRPLSRFYHPGIAAAGIVMAVLVMPRLPSVSDRSFELAWFDAPLVQSFEFEAVTPAGEIRPIPRKLFEPYGILFSQADFGFLTKEPMLIDTYGSTDNLSLAEQLETDSAAQVRRLIAERGRVQFDPAIAKGFATVISTVFSRMHERGGKELAPLSWLSPPSHIQTSAPENPLETGEQVCEVRVRLLNVLNRDGERTVLDDRVVRRIAVLPEGSAAPDPSCAGADTRWTTAGGTRP